MFGMRGQSRFQSIMESCVNVLIGYGIALLSQMVIFPFFGIHVSISDNLEIGAWFTGISLVRSFVVRRFFNRWMLHR